MAERTLHLDVSPGESRGVVALGGRPERLLIEREGEDTANAQGAVVVGRVRAVEPAAHLAFIQLAGGGDGVLNLGPEIGRLVEGAFIEAEIRSEARRGKSAVLRWIGPAEGPVRGIVPGPPLQARLAAFAPRAEIRGGAAARAMADLAQDEALAIEFPLAGGGRIFVEPTRALTAVDVDLAAAGGDSPKRAARATNLQALAEAARILRLKGLGGLVVIDLVGRGHDSAALLTAARAAFAADNPGVVMGQVSRLGALELAIPRRGRPVVEILAGEGGAPNAQTLGLALLRALEREARADGGGRFEGIAAPAVAQAAAARLPRLTERVGARLAVRAEPGRAPEAFQVARL